MFPVCSGSALLLIACTPGGRFRIGGGVIAAVVTSIEVGYKARGTCAADVVVGTIPNPPVSIAWSRLPSRPTLEELRTVGFEPV